MRSLNKTKTSIFNISRARALARMCVCVCVYVLRQSLYPFRYCLYLVLMNCSSEVFLCLTIALNMFCLALFSVAEEKASCKAYHLQSLYPFRYCLYLVLMNCSSEVFLCLTIALNMFCLALFSVTEEKASCKAYHLATYAKCGCSCLLAIYVFDEGGDVWLCHFLNFFINLYVVTYSTFLGFLKIRFKLTDGIEKLRIKGFADLPIFVRKVTLSELFTGEVLILFDIQRLK